MNIKWLLKKASAGNKAYLYLVFRNANERALFKSPFSIEPENWNQKYSRVVGCRDRVSLQKELDTFMRRMENAMQDSCGIRSNLPAKVVRDRTVAMFDGKVCNTSDTFLSLFRKFIVVRERPKSTADSFNYTIDKVRAYAKNAESLLLDDITEEWVIGFESWMLKSGLKQNTAAIHLENIRTCINYAVRNNLTNNSTFRRFTIRREEAEKRALDFDTMCQIWHYKAEKPFEQLCIDMFNLQVALCGINMADLFYLRDDNIVDGRLEYVRQKTKKHHVHVSIKITPEAERLIQAHKGKDGMLLNLSERCKDHKAFLHGMNDRLQLIGPYERKGRGGKIVERKPLWPKLTTYYSRHSIATLLARLGTPVDAIAMGLGHKLSGITYRYITPDYTSLDNAMRHALDCLNASSLDVRDKSQGTQQASPSLDAEKLQAILAIING